ncbi:MAG: hypothetical protein AAFY71_17860 [Bacteroidota bacterium]
MTKLKMLFYGINGTGLGHISRLLNIAEASEELLLALQIRPEIYFLTTSEAPWVSSQYPTYKIPSKTIVSGSHSDNKTYISHAHFFVSNLTALFRPDILIMDTMPQGSFGEMTSMIPFCKQKVFINRHKNADVSQDEIHQRHLALYDLVLTPDQLASSASYSLPQKIADKNVFTGFIHGYYPEKVLDRASTREALGVTADEKLIYISAGGGGDKHAVHDLDVLVKGVLAHTQAKILVGYGPLFKGKKIYHPRVIPFTDYEVRDYFPALDAAISAGGYNSFHELTAAAIPTLFFAQQKGMDVQERRIQLGVDSHWNLFLENLDPYSIEESLEKLLRESEQKKLRTGLATKLPDWGSHEAASQMLLMRSDMGKENFVSNLYRVLNYRLAWPLIQRNNMEFALSARIALWIEIAQTPSSKRIDSLANLHQSWKTKKADPKSSSYIQMGAQMAELMLQNDFSEKRMKRLWVSFLKNVPLNSLEQEEIWRTFSEYFEEKLKEKHTEHTQAEKP